MFEDQNKNPETKEAGAVPSTGAEDIFSDTDKTSQAQVAPIGAVKSPATPSAQPGPPTALSGGKLQPASALVPSAPSSQITGAPESATKKFIIIVALSLVFIVIVGVGYMFFRNSQATAPEVPELGSPTEAETIPPEEDNSIPLVEEEIESTPPKDIEEEEDTGGFFQDFRDKSIESALNPIVDPAKTDTDQDGLSDAQEYEINTNPRLVDSDNDGLSDWEEYAIFGTDPINKDSDSDGYSDGEEVQNGYDPNGSGKLLNFEK